VLGLGQLSVSLSQKESPLSNQSKEKTTMNYKGTWHIYEMEMWGEDYFNMEVQAYVTIEDEGSGHFQFGLVSGQMDGEVIQKDTIEKFNFTWDGNDECDSASGNGWLKIRDKDTIEGKINFHMGDRSTFLARRVK